MERASAIIPEKEKSLIHGNGLIHVFGSRRVLSGVDLSLHGGESVLLAGPNGVGKTTLLRILSGILKPTKGHLAFGSSYRGASFFSPASGLYEDLSVGENLELYARLYQTAPSHLQSISQTFHLQELRDRRVRELSWGQRIRAGLGRTFLKPASVYYLDEPLTGLDERTERRVLDFFADLKKQGITVVVVSHHLELLQDWATNRWTLEGGKLVS